MASDATVMETAPQAAPITLGAHHVRLTVTDLERSISFYTKVLGFKLLLRYPQGDRAMLGAGALMLGLNVPGREISAEEGRFDESRVGLDHIAFGVGSADDVRKGAERLDACGIPNSGVRPGVLPGATLVVFRDPDNIQLEYYHLPRDLAP